MRTPWALRRRCFEILDLFCGAGGTSTGAIEAAELRGLTPRVTGVNHWERATETFAANHGEGHRVLCTGVDDINPRELYRRPGTLKLLWASPECTHHSVARGGKPINDQSRATAWCVARFADALLPPIVLVENVPEFRTWGPCDRKGKPIAAKKGAIFHAWIEALRALGYRVDHRVLCAADFGDPTTRRRLFVQAVRGGRKIVWPEPTHGEATRPFRTARDHVIDWSLACGSIYERERPLSPKTMMRIYAGLEKFSGAAFMTPGFAEREGQRPRTHSLDVPAPTIAASGHLHLAQPFLVELRGTSEQQCRSTARSLDEPMSPVACSGAHHGLARPYLVQVNHGNGRCGQNGNARRSRAVDEPLPTVCGARGEWALCDPALLPQQSDGRLRPVSEPVPTVATDGAIALIEPFLVKYYGQGCGQRVGVPLGTVTTKDRFGLARPVVVVNGERFLLDIGFRMLQPHELAAAQGFRSGYVFSGTKTDQVKQIGNAVPRRLARALVTAVLAQTSDVGAILGDLE
ncbi:MAG: DNA cytosine methyltransferase [Chthoniobacteraceae bacterium]